MNSFEQIQDVNMFGYGINKDTGGDTSKSYFIVKHWMPFISSIKLFLEVGVSKFKF